MATDFLSIEKYLQECRISLPYNSHDSPNIKEIIAKSPSAITDLEASIGRSPRGSFISAFTTQAHTLSKYAPNLTASATLPSLTLTLDLFSIFLHVFPLSYLSKTRFPNSWNLVFIISLSVDAATRRMLLKPHAIFTQESQSTWEISHWQEFSYCALSNPAAPSHQYIWSHSSFLWGLYYHLILTLYSLLNDPWKLPDLKCNT